MSSFFPVSNIDSVVAGITLQWLPFNQNQAPALNFPLTDLVTTNLQVYKQEVRTVADLFVSGDGTGSDCTVSVLPAEFPNGIVSMVGFYNQDQVNKVYIAHCPIDNGLGAGPYAGSGSFVLTAGGFVLMSLNGAPATTPINLWATVTGQSSLVTVFIAGS